MNCDTVQKTLIVESARRGVEIAEHLEGCAACSRFAERLAMAHETLETHHAGVRPDPAFAARVVANLPEPSPVLGWAALRLLPAATALLLVLSAWVWFGTDTPSEMVAAAPTDDLVSWVLEDVEVNE
jgi:hypothetical protein